MFKLLSTPTGKVIGGQAGLSNRRYGGGGLKPPTNSLKTKSLDAKVKANIWQFHKMCEQCFCQIVFYYKSIEFIL